MALNTDQNIFICFGNNGSKRIELVLPMDIEKLSTVDTYLSKIRPTAYRFCYKTNDFDKDISEMEM